MRLNNTYLPSAIDDDPNNCCFLELDGCRLASMVPSAWNCSFCDLGKRFRLGLIVVANRRGKPMQDRGAIVHAGSEAG